MAATNGLEVLKQVTRQALMDEFKAQGHYMKGTIVTEMEFKTKLDKKGLVLEGWMAPYGSYLRDGTPSDKIPYNPGARTGAGTSKYIQALIWYAQARIGARSLKSATSIAFAIAAKQKKEGMPTKNSYKFSSTGKRKEWIQEAFKHKENEITQAVQAMAEQALRVQFDAMVEKWQIEFQNDKPSSNGPNN